MKKRTHINLVGSSSTSHKKTKRQKTRKKTGGGRPSPGKGKP